MNQSDRKNVAILIKRGRATKRITQQELADLTGISLRSVQRIENEEVLPRPYTIRVLAKQLGILEQINELDLPPFDQSERREEDPIKRDIIVTQSASRWGSPSASRQLNRPRKIILSIGIGVLMILGTIAYIAQSARFPETDFEGSLLWMGIAGVYILILFRLWK